MKKYFSNPLSFILFFALFTVCFSSALVAQSINTNPFYAEDVIVTDTQEVNEDQLYAKAFAELTTEEYNFIEMKLLPTYYPILKMCADGKEPFSGKNGGLAAAQNLCKSFYPQGNGHFSRDFGNPYKMLAWAQKYHKDKKFVELVTSMKRGDILLNGPKNEKDIDKNLICFLSKGPYYHAVLIVDGPPPVIVEAVGVTGNTSDPTKDKVRYNTWYEEFGTWCKYRLVRPTYGLDSNKANPIIDKALSYAESQLGKPYDYAFSNDDDDNAFYCSELASKAYINGADFSGNITQKDPNRDKVVIAINALIDGLEPKNKYELTDKITNFAISYAAKPNIDDLQDFVVNQLTPECGILDDIFSGSEGRERLNNVFNKVKSNEAFTNFSEALKSYNTDKEAGKFDTGWGIGFVQKVLSKADVGLSLLKDINSLAKDTGASVKELTTLLGKLFLPVYQNLGTVSEVLGGLDKNDQIELPEGVKTVLSITNWAVEKREEVKKWPVIGETLAQLMPGNGDGKIHTDLTSPSDLAQASPGFVVEYP